jgi:hypothetical protein
VTSALFNNLTRGQRYAFHLGTPYFTEAVFHEYMPDGTLRCATTDGKTCYINPSLIHAAFEATT